jgi:hypothetical protein
VPGQLALGEEISKKKQISSPSVALGEEVAKKKKFLPRVLRSGKSKKNPVDGVKSSPRVLPWHSGKSSSSVRFLALGEELFPVSRFPGSSSQSVALGECFPECFWLFPECLRHSRKQLAPVVVVLLCSAIREPCCSGE